MYSTKPNVTVKAPIAVTKGQGLGSTKCQEWLVLIYEKLLVFSLFFFYYNHTYKCNRNFYSFFKILLIKTFLFFNV